MIHVGGNDLGQVPLGNIRLNIFTILETLLSLLPHTKFVYPQILPGLYWRHEVKHYVVEKTRKRLNSFVASVIIRAGGCYIKYPEICEKIHFFHTVVGTHLSNFGNVLFLYRLQQGLQVFCLLPFVFHCR